MFTKFNLDFSTDLFEELSKSVEFEDITTGRKGGVLVDVKDSNIPIVRTTTLYNKPAQKFLPIHYDIIEQIKKVTKFPDLEFNNALIELYDNKYTTMGFHSDQALDLVDDSYICLFSCYDNETIDSTDLRKLKIKNKITNEHSEITLDHNSIVLFSTSTNSKHLHKIVLDSVTSDTKWLGITFRLSKTLVKFIDSIPVLSSSGEVLEVANSDQKKEFYKLRSLENSSVEYIYPSINFTISMSDILPIK